MVFGTNNVFLGWFSMCVAIVGFGFCTTPIKLKSVRKANVDPMLFQIFYSFVIFLCCLPVLEHSSHSFTIYGILGAAMWVPGSVFGIFSIKFLGLGVAQGLWSVGSMVTGFLWGILYFHQECPNLGLSILGIVLLCIGVLFMATSELNISLNCLKRKKKTKVDSDEDIKEMKVNVDEKSLLVENEINSDEESNNDPIIQREVKKKDGIRNLTEYCLGLGCVLIFSLLNGSMMVPSKIDASDDIYLFEYGIGVLFVTPLVAILYFFAKSVFFKVPVLEPKQIKAGLVPGCMSGLLWSFGNYGTLFSIYSPIGLAIAVPLSQTALVISGLSGMILFGELKS